MTGTRFYLGTHQPGWLAKAGVPLMVSDRRLRVYKRLPRATAPWVLDSGGFTELRDYGRWTADPASYAARVRRYRREVGRMEWAAPQDWMCEPIVITGGRIGPQLFAGTHLPVAEHQHRTVANLAQLREFAPEVPWLPVLQGFTVAEYLHCIDLYTAAGFNLRAEPVVGVGSVCRRQGTAEAHQIFTALTGRGLHRLHGFGVKTLGLLGFHDTWASTDSMAWSLDGRRRNARPGCAGRHKNCANCLPYALAWRERLLTGMESRAAQLAAQPHLFDLEETA